MRDQQIILDAVNASRGQEAGLEINVGKTKVIIVGIEKSQNPPQYMSMAKS